MNEFEFFNVSRIVFGRGKFGQLGAIAASMGSRALVVHNVHEPARRRTEELLVAAGVAVHFHRQTGEPKSDDFDRAIVEAKQNECDLVIGLGGGSAIDAAKAVAGLLTNGGVALDYMEIVGKGQKITRPAAPWIAVPTTAGTGAEATRNAVIGYPPKQFKASIRSEMLLPRVALIDPELHVSVRPEVTARSGMDALCQCIEAYTSKGANPMTDAVAIRGVTLAARSIRRAFENGNDLDAREDMALAALLSGIALTNAGLGAVHGFAAPLGASFPMPHGTICAALLPAVVRGNVGIARELSRQHPVLTRYADVGRAMGAPEDADPIEFVERETSTLVKDLQIPPLREFGLRQEHLREQVELAKKSSSMRYNPVTLSDPALVGILVAGMDGMG